MIINMKLATQPGVPNVNGIVYFEEDYKPMLEHINSLIESNTCFVQLSLRDDNGFIRGLDLTNIFGRVVKKYPDSVDIEVIDPFMKSSIEDGMNMNDFDIGMCYRGELEKIPNSENLKATKLKFIYYYLQKIPPRD